MDEVRRLKYLQAMGIDVYTRQPSPMASDSAPTSNQTELDTTNSPVEDNTNDWKHLKQQVSTCQQCELANTRTQTVFGIGNTQADWLVIGESPGADEDKQGEPFVGRAGELLNEMLWAVDHPRERVYITNILKCRPPNNRDPRPEEVAQCSNYLQQQIAWVKPKIILCVGRIAAQNLLKVDTPIGQLRGKVHHIESKGKRIPVVVTYHPAYLLRSPKEKRKVWQDLQMALTL